MLVHYFSYVFPKYAYIEYAFVYLIMSNNLQPRFQGSVSFLCGESLNSLRFIDGCALPLNVSECESVTCNLMTVKPCNRQLQILNEYLAFGSRLYPSSVFIRIFSILVKLRMYF